MIRTIYLTPMSHCDLGYTDPAAEVRRKHVRHLRDVLALCRVTENNPQGLQFKWTCEASWTVKEFLNHADSEEAVEFFHYVRNGQIEIGGFFGILQFELPSLEEMIRCCEYSITLAREHDFCVRTAIINDVPGVHRGLVDVLSGCNIPYLLWGPNTFRALVGWSDLPSLFYLQSRSGKRILIWRNGHDRRIKPQDSIGCQADYGLGDQYVISPYRKAHGIGDEGNLSFVERGVLQAKGREAIDTILEKMAYDRYPYDALLLQCAADNRGPDPELMSTVESLNRDYPDLTFVIATPSEFFRDVESRYQSSIPAYSGDFVDAWTDGVAASAQSMADYRQLQIDIERLELVLARTGNADSKVASQLRDLYENLLLYSEHTFGARGYDWPTLSREGLIGSWRDKASYVRQGRMVLDAIGTVAAPTPAEAYADDLVCQYPVIENTFYRITATPSGRIESIWDKELNREVIDPHQTYPFNALIFHQLIGISEGSADKGGGKYYPLQVKAFVADIKNARMDRKRDRIEFTADCVFDNPPVRVSGKSTVILYAHQKRIDVINTIDKEESPAKEALYVAFPFNLRKGEFKTRLEMACNLQRFPDDLLSCSHSDFVGIRHFVSLSDEDLAVTWVTHDAPLVEIGDIRTFQWAGADYRPESPVLFSYVINNTWPTNFQLWQGGTFTFRYSLTTDRTFDPARCSRFKQQVLQPEYAEARIDPESVILTGVRLNDDCAVDVRLLEVSGRSGIGRLPWPGVKAAWLTDLIANSQQPLPVSPNESVTFPYSHHGLINIRLTTKERDYV